MLWGRIAYNKQISDNIFKNQMAKRFPKVSSETLFNAWAFASRPLPKVQELTQGTWGLDAHWFAEASLYPNNGGSYFRFLDDFVVTEVAKTSSSNLCSVASSAAGTCGTAKTTYKLADEMEADAQKALNLIDGMTSQGDTKLEVKINNIKQLAYLSIHFAFKIRAATYKKANQIPSARDAMGKAYCWWMKYVNSMDAMYKGNRFRTVEIKPDWHYADALQLKDYTDLGGVGIPNCDITAIDNIKMSNSDNNDIYIYPNPVSSILNIDISGVEKERDFKIFNSDGKLVHILQTKKTSIKINIKSLNIKGYVTVQIMSDNKISNRKIVIT